jgi:hypothetical protein
VVRAFASGSAEPIATTALLDTGSTVCIVSPAIAAALRRHGAELSTDTTVLRTANGDVTLDAAIDFLAEATVRGRAVRFPIKAWVHDVGEELVLGFPFLDEHGLTSLLQRGRGTNDPEEQPDMADGIASDRFDSDAAGEVWVEPNVSEGLATAISAVLEEYDDLFGSIPKEGAAVRPMPIQLKPDGTPRVFNPRRLSPAMQAAVSEEVRAL